MNSTYWLNQIMRTMYTSPNTFFIGLSSTQPTSDGSGVSEPSGYNYARVRVNCFSPPAGGVVYNMSDLAFPKSTGIWFDATNRAKYWVLFDNSGSSANVLASGLLDDPKIVEGNTTIIISAQTLRISLSDFQESY